MTDLKESLDFLENYQPEDPLVLASADYLKTKHIFDLWQVSMMTVSKVRSTTQTPIWNDLIQTPRATLANIAFNDIEQNGSSAAVLFLLSYLFGPQDEVDADRIEPAGQQWLAWRDKQDSNTI